MRVCSASVLIPDVTVPFHPRSRAYCSSGLIHEATGLPSKVAVPLWLLGDEALELWPLTTRVLFTVRDGVSLFASNPVANDVTAPGLPRCWRNWRINALRS